MENKTQYMNYAGLLEFMYLNHEYTDLYLSHCGMQQCKPGHLYEQTSRPDYHLHFILDGQGTLRMGEQTYRLKRGQAFVIPPDVTDYSYQADVQNPWYYAWAAFNGEKAAQYMSHAGFDRSHIVRETNIPAEEFTTLIHNMLLASQLTINNELDRTGTLFLLLSRLIESYESHSGGSGYNYSADTYVKHALQYMQFNYNTNIQVNDIVRYVGINRSYFSRIFKEQMHISPKEYLQQYRMEQARQLLLTSPASISDISMQVGYPDPFTFSKLFHRLEGMSPRDFRKKYRDEQL